MIKHKKGIENIFRLKNNEARENKLCLDKNERIKKFEKIFLKNIFSKLSSDKFTNYPEVDDLYNSIAKHHKLNKNKIVVTAGIDGAIKSCFELFVSKNDKVVVMQPTFAMVDVYCKIFGAKKNPILIDISKFKNKKSQQIKYFNNSFLLQDKNQKIIEIKKLKFVTKLKPSKKELKYAEFAFNICKFVKSNSIVISNNFSTIGIGAGQPSRFDSCKIAAQKANKFQPKKLRNSIAASDAFFPFPDGVKKLINAGVKLIIQPGGSIKDKEIIEVANKAKVKMVFTGLRHFNH